MKILIAYTHFPCSIGRYWKYGFQDAGHQVDSVGYFSGGEIPWPGGPWRERLEKYADPVTYPVERLTNRYHVRDQVYALCRDPGYDLFVNIDAAYYWEGALPIPKVIVGTDTHCLNYSQQRRDCDLFIGMHYHYLESGDVWVPYAYSPTDHFKANVPKDHFITHIGVEYETRRRLLDYLQTHWKVFRGLGILYGEGSAKYSAGDLALCLPSERDLATRFWEAMAYGNVPLQKRVPDLQQLSCREGAHYYGFDDEAELLEGIKYLEKNPETVAQIQQQAWEWVRPHTWQDRAEQVIAILQRRGLLKEESID